MEKAAEQIGRDHGATFAAEWLSRQCSADACSRRAFEASPQAKKVSHYMELCATVETVPELTAELTRGMSAVQFREFLAVKRARGRDGRNS